MTLSDKRTKGFVKDFSRAFTKLTAEVSPRKVHRLRTTIRRIENFIGYGNPDPGSKQRKLLEELISLRKRAGKVRDCDVQIRLLGSIANRSTSSDQRVLVELLKAKRDKQTRRLLAALKKLERSGLLARLEKIIERPGFPDSGSPQITPLEHAKNEIVKLSVDISAHQSIKPGLLDELRVSLKRIRYTAELAEESAGRNHFLESLKPAQRALGEWHDWESLVKTAEKQFGDRANCPLLVEMRSLFATRYAAANSAVTRFFSSFAPGVRKQPRLSSSLASHARLAS
jgi:CHAD domain-containing protein